MLQPLGSFGVQLRVVEIQAIEDLVVVVARRRPGVVGARAEEEGELEHHESGG